MYYIIVKRGVPLDVTSNYPRAVQVAKELSTPGAEATIIPVAGVGAEQLAFRFEGEDFRDEPTSPDTASPRGAPDAQNTDENPEELEAPDGSG